MFKVSVRKELEEEMIEAWDSFKGKKLPRWLKDWEKEKKQLAYNPVKGERVPYGGHQKCFSYYEDMLNLEHKKLVGWLRHLSCSEGRTIFYVFVSGELAPILCCAEKEVHIIDYWRGKKPHKKYRGKLDGRRG